MVGVTSRGEPGAEGEQLGAEAEGFPLQKVNKMCLQIPCSGWKLNYPHLSSIITKLTSEILDTS